LVECEYEADAIGGALLSCERAAVRDVQSFHKERSNDMQVGIPASGLMGGKLGALFARAGHDVLFSYSPSREKLGTGA
jgi:hypothetical protein